MIQFLYQADPFLLAVLASLFTWSITLLGAATVFFFRGVNKKLLNTMAGFAAGVMIAASFWSLLDPAINLSKNVHSTAWLAPAVGFLLGGFFVLGSGMLLERLLKKDDSLPIRKKNTLLFMSVTIHNIPEGLCIGVAFGVLKLGIEGADLAASIMLALGIGLQNFPEGASVSLPMFLGGSSRSKAFVFGQASGLVEPSACVVGYLLAATITSLLPLSLGFSAGAMIAVAAGELLPDAASDKNFAVGGCIFGFVIMMILDVALG